MSIESVLVNVINNLNLATGKRWKIHQMGQNVYDIKASLPMKKKNVIKKSKDVGIVDEKLKMKNEFCSLGHFVYKRYPNNTLTM